MFIKASQVLILIYCFSVIKADDGCWHACPNVYEPVCGMDGEAMQVFGNECIMEIHNICFETGEFGIIIWFVRELN